jgi:hypothetical protein
MGVKAFPIETTVTLVIGEIARWQSHGKSTPRIPGFTFVEIDHLTYALLQQIQPQVILSPLVTDGFDAVDVAMKLQAFGYLGRYRVVTEDLPNMRMVICEIQSSAPRLDIDLFVLPTQTEQTDDRKSILNVLDFKQD